MVCNRADTVRVAAALLIGALCLSKARADSPGPQAIADSRCPPESAADPHRRSPDVPVLRFDPTPCNPNALPAPAAGSLREGEGLPDRWRLVTLLGYRADLWNPYAGNNVLKGDRPMFGEDWFVHLSGISDTALEERRLPVPVGSAAPLRPGSFDALGNGRATVFSQSFALEAVLYEGDTVFKPPEYEFRFTPVVSLSHVAAEENGFLSANGELGTTRTQSRVGLQAFFLDKHLRDVSAHYDFDAIRVGVQPFTSDFRGFLFEDSPLGVRLFGNRDSNRYQYNLAWFRRIDKDLSSGLNDLLYRGTRALRADDIFAANLYIQDLPNPGFTSQATVLYERNREGGEIVYGDNGVLQRPAALGLVRASDYDVVYVGLNGDGHFGRWNLTTSVYGAFGGMDRGPFVERTQQIRAGFAALELSRDFSWMRVRGSFAFATPDTDPFDGRATGFDAIYENPLFAGADTSFWIHESVPLIGGGGVALSAHDGLLSSLRSSKELGQSNFVNPGLALAGLGADLDLTPTVRVTGNASYLAFADTTVLEIARSQPGIERPIGLDVSLALTWRPLAIQNIVARVSAATLVPGAGYRDLYGTQLPYAVSGNLVLTY